MSCHRYSDPLCMINVPAVYIEYTNDISAFSQLTFPDFFLFQYRRSHYINKMR